MEVYNPEREKFLELFKKGDSIFLTGRAGTGKSTLIRDLIINSDKKLIVVAPTGVAAINLRAKTIHSFFLFPLRPILPDDKEAIKKLPGKKRRILSEADTIIIDEVSMVRADILDAVDQSIRLNLNSQEPFGGKQIIFVGDLFQLKPVITNRFNEKVILAEHYPLPAYFFDSRAFNELDPRIIELKHVYRQDSDKLFLEILDKVRMGRQTRSDIQALNNRYSPDYAGDQIAIELCTTNKIVNEINETKLAKLPTSSITFRAEIEDNFDKNLYPTHDVLTLKKGAQVMFIKNGEEYVNGTLGKIIELASESIEVELDTGEVITVEKATWDNIEYSYDSEKKRIESNTIGTFTQYPLKLAWAVTIHKSQGLTFNNMFLNLGFGAFDSGQTYVALSRCKTLEGIILRKPIKYSDIKIDDRVVDFWFNKIE